MRTRVLLAILLCLMPGVMYADPLGSPIENPGLAVPDAGGNIDFSTNSVTGAVRVLDNVAAPTGSQMYGSLNAVTGTHTTLLPAAVAGMSICVMDVAGTASNIIVDVNIADNVVLDGVEQAAGVGITNASGSSFYDFVCLMAPKTTKWVVTGYQGTWASQ